MTPNMNSGRSLILRSIVLIALVLGLGAGTAGVLVAYRVEPPRREQAVLPPVVESIVVEPRDLIEQFVGYGTVRAMRRADLAAEVAASVVNRTDGIREGSAVSAGQVVLYLDDREYRHVLEQARARADAEEAALQELDADAQNLNRLIKTAENELRVAQAEKTRVTDLFERGLAAKKEYDFADLAFQQARRVLEGYRREFARIAPRRARSEASKRGYEAEAALARLNIERCRIKAPFDGRIASLQVDVGHRVAPGSVVLTLVDASRVEIPVQLRASVYDLVQVGATCTVDSEVRSDAVWDGQVARIAPVADEQTRTFAAYIVVDNASLEHQLVPGTFVRVEVAGPRHAGALLVPRGACRHERVYVVENDLARARSVTTGRVMRDRVLITAGLTPGDRVILSHLDKLTDGSPVRVRELLPESQVSAYTKPSNAPITSDAETSGRRQPPAQEAAP